MRDPADGTELLLPDRKNKLTWVKMKYTTLAAAEVKKGPPLGNMDA